MVCAVYIELSIPEHIGSVWRCVWNYILFDGWYRAKCRCSGLRFPATVDVIDVFSAISGTRRWTGSGRLR